MQSHTHPALSVFENPHVEHRKKTQYVASAFLQQQSNGSQPVAHSPCLVALYRWICFATDLFYTTIERQYKEVAFRQFTFVRQESSPHFRKSFRDRLLECVFLHVRNHVDHLGCVAAGQHHSPEKAQCVSSVSYTHLTLPTICSV